MKHLTLDLIGARILRPRGGLGGGLERGRLSLTRGRITADKVGRKVDLTGYLVMPGIVDMHGDGFERHLAPRRGAMKDLHEGVLAAEAELAANGITTGVMAQFFSWEGGMRGPEFAERVFTAIIRARLQVVSDLIPQLRFETNMLDHYTGLADKIAQWQVPYVVFNDHLPHDRLAAGQRPPRLTGQALKAGRSPDAHLEMLTALHARVDEVPQALDVLCRDLAHRGVRMGSHDDQTAATRQAWRARGVVVSEFPETVEAAEAARAGGDAIVLGAPNVVRGGSHKGNASAVEMISSGLCDALASDYHYPSPRCAALTLVREGVVDLGTAWALVSQGPAVLLGLRDRGILEPGMRADLVVLEQETYRVGATIAGGQVSYMSGEVAARFIDG